MRATTAGPAALLPPAVPVTPQPSATAVAWPVAPSRVNPPRGLVQQPPALPPDPAGTSTPVAALPPVSAPPLPAPTASPTAAPPTATPVPTPVPLTDAGLPVRLRIPILGINTTVESVGLVNGAMDVPTNVWDVAWYKYGTRPGNTGNAVIDGHLDSATGPAVFLYLHNLPIGSLIYVTDDRGVERAFAVTEMDSYGLNDAPLLRIFGPSSDADLNLITCSGTWDYQHHIYNQRLVVYARLVAGSAQPQA